MMTLWPKLLEQLMLVSAAMLLAVFIGVPTGILVWRLKKLRLYILGTASVLQTIPSLALLAILLPLTGIGMKPAIIALTLYALLPVIRNTVTGLENIPAQYRETARALGLTFGQRLRLIELPLALPVILAGIRTATAMTIGIATIAAFIGAGGLGDFINQGLAMNSTRLLLLGALPAALLALLFDGLLAFFEKKLNRAPTAAKPARHREIFWGSLFFFLGLFIFSSSFYFSAPVFQKNLSPIRIASKNFTEQYILAEIIAELIKAHTTIPVELFLNLGSTSICQAAITRGDIDIYPEYTGTAYMTVLHQNKILPPNDLFNDVKSAYIKKYNILWLAPLGFNNSQSLTVREKFARRYQLKNISDLLPFAPKLVLAAPAEFPERPDGLPALQKTYGLTFGEVRGMDAGLMYKAIANKEAGVIAAYTTDGRIAAYHLRVLKDDKQAFPAYQAAILIRTETLKKYPQLAPLLNRLSGQLDDKTMRELNYAVDVEKQSPQAVARAFLQAHHDV